MPALEIKSLVGGLGFMGNHIFGDGKDAGLSTELDPVGGVGCKSSHCNVMLPHEKKGKSFMCRITVSARHTLQHFRNDD